MQAAGVHADAAKVKNKGRIEQVMRSLLFVPADSEKKLAKGLDSGADAVILDLEDSVAAERKAGARAMALAFLRAFPGKVDTGFPKGNATNLESRALSSHGASDFMVNLSGKRPSAMNGSSGYGAGFKRIAWRPNNNA